MELMGLYNQIHNPLDNPKVIERLIEIYSSNLNYYNQLTRVNSKQYSNQYNEEDKEKFEVMMFNVWKNNIVAMTKEEWHELYQRGIYGKDLIALRKYLKTIPDVSTKREIDDAFQNANVDERIKSARRKYDWDQLSDGIDWVHVCSRYVNAKKEEVPNVEHRLYLNTESVDTYKMATIFVEKCNKHHLPYYFKFAQDEVRDDTIVIYSNTENLTKYIDVLQEIKREHPQLVSRTKEPPILTGQIDGWIGYGSETSRDPNGEKQSFNQVRSKCVERALDKATVKWIIDHKDIQIRMRDGKTMSFQELFTAKIAQKMMETLEKKYLAEERNEKGLSQQNGKQYNEKNVIAYTGFSLQDLRSEHFKQGIYKLAEHNARHIDRNFNYTIHFTTANGDEKFISDNYASVIHELAGEIAKHSKSYTQYVQSQIKKNAEKYGIDDKKFCFDVKAVERMQKWSLKQEQTPEPTPQPIYTENVEKQEETQHTEQITEPTLEPTVIEEYKEVKEPINPMANLSNEEIQAQMEQLRQEMLRRNELNNSAGFHR